MINSTFVKFVTTTYILILSSLEISAQSKYGKDEQACKENISVFREYCKQKNYEDLNPWRKIYRELSCFLCHHLQKWAKNYQSSN